MFAETAQRVTRLSVVFVVISRCLKDRIIVRLSIAMVVASYTLCQCLSNILVLVGYLVPANRARGRNASPSCLISNQGCGKPEFGSETALSHCSSLTARLSDEPFHKIALFSPHIRRCRRLDKYQRSTIAVVQSVVSHGCTDISSNYRGLACWLWLLLLTRLSKANLWVALLRSIQVQLRPRLPYEWLMLHIWLFTL